MLIVLVGLVVEVSVSDCVWVVAQTHIFAFSPLFLFSTRHFFKGVVAQIISGKIKVISK